MLPGWSRGGTLNGMPTRQTFYDFLRHHEGASAEELSERYPLGCLLTRAKITESNQDVTEVLPLVPRVADQPVVVGRGLDVDVLISSGKVSKQHAEFQLKPSGSLVLTDLSSSNGTFVNGRRLTPGQATRVEAGTSELWFANTQFFHFDGRALSNYVRHLRPVLAQRKPPGSLPSVGSNPRARTGEFTRPGDVTHVMHRDELRAQDVDPSVGERWRAALKALGELIKNAERVQLRLALQPDPVTIYDAQNPEADPGSVLATLEGLQSMVQGVTVVFQRSGFELTVFDREAQVP